MKLEEFKLKTPLYVPYSPPQNHHGLPDWEEELGDTNEAFQPLVVLDDSLPIMFRRCPQCAALSITMECSRCANHPKMVSVNMAETSRQMELTGRVCSHYATSNCINRIETITKWCKSCREFWAKEFNPIRERVGFNGGNLEPIITRVLLSQKGEPFPQAVIEAKDLEDDEHEEEEWLDELEDTGDKLDRACSLLISVKYLLEFLADRKLKTVIEPQDRSEMLNFSTLISELIVTCGFDAKGNVVEGEIVDEVEEKEFDNRDKELLEHLEEERTQQSAKQMMD